MPKISLDVELNASGVASEARAAAREAADAIDSEVSSAGKAAGDAAGDRIGSAVESGARSGAKSAGASIDSEVSSAGRTAGDAAGAAIEAGVEAGADAGAAGASESIEGIASRASAVFGALGAGAALAGIDGLASSAAEAQSYMSRLEASARANSVSAEAMGSTYSSLVGVLGETDRSVETSGNLFALCGDNQEQLQQLTTSLTGAYAQFGDGMPIEALAEAANETAKVGTVTGSFADSLNWVSASTEQWSAALSGNPAAMAAFQAGIDAGLSKEDAFNQALAACTSEQERQQLVISTLSALYGEAGAAYQETNADMIAYNQSQDELSSSMNGVGESLMPLMTGLQSLGADVLSGAVQPAVQWLVDNLPIIGPILAGLVTTIGLLTVVTNAQTIASAAQQVATNGLAVAQGALNAVMSANPIAIVLVLIAGLVVALMGLWNSSEGFRAFVTSAFETIGSVASTVIGSIVNFFTVTVPGAVGGLLASVGQIPGQVASFLGGALSSAASFVSSFASSALDAAGQFVSNIVSGLSGLGERVMSIGSDIVSGIWDGISGAAGWLMDQIGGFADDVIGGIAGFFGIASPSKVMRRLFRWVPIGAAEGIGDEAHVVSEAMEDMGSRAVGGLVVGGAGGSGGPLPGVAASVRGSQASRASAQGWAVSQTINFNQPVPTPDETARVMRMYGRYGLAGVV